MIVVGLLRILVIIINILQQSTVFVLPLLGFFLVLG